MTPNGWREVKLGDLLEFRNGVNSEAANYGSGSKFVNVMDIFENRFLTQDRIRGTVSVTPSQEASYALRRGDILFNRTSETFDEIALSSVYLDDKHAIFGGFVIRGRPRDGRLSPEFSCYCFGSDAVRREVIRRGQGAIRANIGQRDLGLVPLLLPPLPEQKKIAEILSAWDKAIETTEKLLANAENQKRALMQQLLTGKRRLEGFSYSEWRRVSLRSVFERVVRKNTSGNQNVLTISGKDGLVSQRDYFNKIVAANDTSGYTLLMGGEFAYNKSYSAGYPLGAIKMLPVEGHGILSSLYICFALKNEADDDRDFYRHWFEYGGLNRELSVIAQEGARNHGLLNVGIGDFFDLQIVQPGKDEQSAIAYVISHAEQEVLLIQRHLDCLRSEKRALKQQLLTGTRRVNV